MNEIKNFIFVTLLFCDSLDGITWLLMPEPSKCAILLTPLAITDFQGDPSILTNVYDANPPFPPNDDIEHFEEVGYYKLINKLLIFDEKLIF